MEVLKHECGVAMVRLLKPLEYYHEKYGSLDVWTEQALFADGKAA